MWLDALKSPYLCTDATGVLVQDDILPDRDSEAARQILGGYKGFVVADGYGVYEHLAKHDGIILVNCWAHARRKFIDLGDAITEELRAEILDLIGKLYAVEKLAPSGPEGLEPRRQLRNRDSRAIVGSIRE